MISFDDVNQAKESAKLKLYNISSIAGIGISKNSAGSLCLRVSVQDDISDQDLSKIPSFIDSIPVQIAKVGPIHFERASQTPRR